MPEEEVVSLALGDFEGFADAEALGDGAEEEEEEGDGVELEEKELSGEKAPVRLLDGEKNADAEGEPVEEMLGDAVFAPLALTVEVAEYVSAERVEV